MVANLLSPSTIDYDRGAKLDFDKSLPTMQDIVLVYQDQMRVEHYRQDGEGWTMQPLIRLVESLALASSPFSIELRVIYSQTALAD